MDSAPANEPAEPFALLETMRLDDGQVPRFERHVHRMAEAARYFGYGWDERAVRQAVTDIVRSHPQGRWRLRLLVDRLGRATVECTSLVPEPSRRWRLAFAAAPVPDPLDPFLRHKTTRRYIYDAARRSRPEVDDVLLWNASGEVTESTICNLVAEIDGVRCTPPVRSGLLAGTFRAEQLEGGAIHERVLTKREVAQAPRLWLINSVRGWIEAELEDVAAQDPLRD